MHTRMANKTRSQRGRRRGAGCGPKWMLLDVNKRRSLSPSRSAPPVTSISLPGLNRHVCTHHHRPACTRTWLMAVSRHQGVHLLLSRISATLLDQLMVIISQREPPPGFMPLRQLLIKAECFGAFAVKKKRKKFYYFWRLSQRPFRIISGIFSAKLKK